MHVSASSTPQAVDLSKLLRTPGERDLPTRPGVARHPSPTCRLDLNQSGFRTGESVTAEWHLSNPRVDALKVELKLWFAAPGEKPVSLSEALSEHQQIELPGTLDEVIGEISLFDIDEETPRGQYEMSCRLLDPITGELLHEDLNLFRIL